MEHISYNIPCANTAPPCIHPSNPVQCEYRLSVCLSTCTLFPPTHSRRPLRTHPTHMHEIEKMIKWKALVSCLSSAFLCHCLSILHYTGMERSSTSGREHCKFYSMPLSYPCGCWWSCSWIIHAHHNRKMNRIPPPQLLLACRWGGRTKRTDHRDLARTTRDWLTRDGWLKEDTHVIGPAAMKVCRIRQLPNRIFMGSRHSVHPSACLLG